MGGLAKLISNVLALLIPDLARQFYEWLISKIKKKQQAEEDTQAVEDLNNANTPDDFRDSVDKLP